MSAATRAAAEVAGTLVGSARHLAMVPPDERRRLEWPGAAAVDAIAGGVA